MWRRILFTLLSSSMALWPQVAAPADHGVTASASRTITLAADEAVFEIVVDAGFGTSMEAVLRALEPAGVLEQHMVGLTSSGSGFVGPVTGQPPVPEPQSAISWQFLLTRPAAQMPETLDRLEELRRRRPGGILQVSFNGYLNASGQAVERARQSLLPGLLSEARRRAEALARAGGFSLGPLLLLSETAVPAGGRASIIGAVGFTAGESAGIRATFFVNVRYGRQ
jgi:hypothetical protein